MLKVNLPDGSKREYSTQIRPIDVAEEIGPGLARATVAAEIDGKLVGADAVLPEEGSVALRLITKRDPEALDVMRHSAAHVMARAVMRLFDGVQLAFGPTVDNGFYYDFEMEHSISEEDFPKIEAEMKKIIKEDEVFERVEMPRDEAIELLRDLGQTLKVEHLEEGLREEETVSFYRQGEFMDLCRGPHVPRPKAIAAVKLMSVAGAYWKADASRQQLQRLYGTAWFDKKELKAYLKQMEEAKRRDHRVLGKRHELFLIDSKVGLGLVLWLPKGATIRRQLELYIHDELMKRGYQMVYSPAIGNVQLYETSGHFPYYRDAQFTPIFQHEAGQLIDVWVERLKAAEKNQTEVDPTDEQKVLEAAQLYGLPVGVIDAYMNSDTLIAKIDALDTWQRGQERFLLRPMNCPHHIRIYESKPRSYRDLPLRIAEFGMVHRFEQSGELGGMTRVRGFTQDDAHIFCTEDQVAAEFRDCMEMTQSVLKTLALDSYRVRLSFRDPDSDKYVGAPEVWDRAEAALQEVCEEMNLENLEIATGEAAFYGPKADFIAKDCVGREWQLGTVQLDYNLPSEERFGLEYVGADNKPHRPVMIHRAPFGSFERFVGMLIEHFAAAFPLWLAPEQVRVLVVSQKFEEYGRSVEEKLREAGLRVSGDYRPEKIGAKIRDAQLELIPYMLVLGAREADEGNVAVRDRREGDLGAMSIDEAIAKFRDEIDTKTVRQ